MQDDMTKTTGLVWEVRRFCDLATISIESTLQRHLLNAGLHDIRPAHFRVFAWLPEDGCRLTDLAARAQTSKQAMNYLVDQLIERGYLERIPDPTDGRAQVIRLSAKGRELEQVTQAAVSEAETRWHAILGEPGIHQFSQMVCELNDHHTIGYRDA